MRLRTGIGVIMAALCGCVSAEGPEPKAYEPGQEVQAEPERPKPAEQVPEPKIVEEEEPDRETEEASGVPGAFRYKTFGRYYVSREGERLSGVIVEVAAVDHVWLDYRYKLRLADGAGEVFLDARPSGYNLGEWVDEPVTLIGDLKRGVQVGEGREPGWDTRRKLLGDVLLVRVIAPRSPGGTVQ